MEGLRLMKIVKSENLKVEIDKFVVKIEELVVEFKKDLTSKLAQSSELLFTELK